MRLGRKTLPLDTVALCGTPSRSSKWISGISVFKMTHCHKHVGKQQLEESVSQQGTSQGEVYNRIYRLYIRKYKRQRTINPYLYFFRYERRKCE